MVYLQFKAIADAEQAEQSAEEDAEDNVSIGGGDRHGSDNNSDEDEDEEEGWQDRSSAQTEQPEGLATTSTVRGEELVVVTDSNADEESNNKRQRNVWRQSLLMKTDALIEFQEFYVPITLYTFLYT